MCLFDLCNWLAFDLSKLLSASLNEGCSTDAHLFVTCAAGWHRSVQAAAACGQPAPRCHAVLREQAGALQHGGVARMVVRRCPTAWWCEGALQHGGVARKGACYMSKQAGWHAEKQICAGTTGHVKCEHRVIMSNSDVASKVCMEYAKPLVPFTPELSLSWPAKPVPLIDHYMTCCFDFALTGPWPRHWLGCASHPHVSVCAGWQAGRRGACVPGDGGAEHPQVGAIAVQQAWDRKPRKA
eukprot:scaffold41845_cov20-Tisochrysis_lutea.AAC.3